MIRRNVRNYFGKLTQVNVTKPTFFEKQNRDTIKAVVEQGSLIIPLKHVPLVKKYIRDNNLSIRDPPAFNEHRSVDVILVRNELIIPPPIVDRVIRFLKSRNIHLPNT